MNWTKFTLNTGLKSQLREQTIKSFTKTPIQVLNKANPRPTTVIANTRQSCTLQSNSALCWTWSWVGELQNKSPGEKTGMQILTRRAATAALPSSLSSSSSSSLHSHPPSSVLWRRPLEPGTRRTYTSWKLIQRNFTLTQSFPLLLEKFKRRVQIRNKTKLWTLTYKKCEFILCEEWLKPFWIALTLLDLCLRASPPNTRCSATGKKKSRSIKFTQNFRTCFYSCLTEVEYGLLWLSWRTYASATQQQLA